MSQWHRDNPELAFTPDDPWWRPPVEPALPVDHDEDQDAELSSLESSEPGKQHWNTVRQGDE